MQIKPLLLLALLPALTLSCEDHLDETPESSFIWNELTPPKYSFQRNDASSVDYQECEFLSKPLNTIYDTYLSPAKLTSDSQMELMLSYYNEGLYGIAPKDEIAQSPLCLPYRESVLADVDRLFDESRQISGGYASQSSTVRNREAQAGESGFIGSNISDPNLLFVNGKGVVVAEVFRHYMYGAIYLDKILNVHLDESIYTSTENRSDHHNVVLPPGRNYTLLEHHWDLAYGYYKNFWKKFAQADGLMVMKHSSRTLFEAFAYGRLAMETYDYEKVMGYLKVIKKELSKVAAIRTMNCLLGPNTVANLEEDPKFAYGFISQAAGLIYALQFASDEEGRLYYTRDELLGYIEQLTSGQGLWDTERLLAGTETEGSLLNIAEKIGHPFGVTPEQIKR